MSVSKANDDNMSSSMTSSITGMGLGGITGLTTTFSALTCCKEPRITVSGMPSDYVPGLSAYYNISSNCLRPGQTHRSPAHPAGPTAQFRPGRSHSTGALHRFKHSVRNSPNTQYSHHLISKLADQNERRRRQDTIDLIPQGCYSQQPLNVEVTEFYSRDNSKDHHTDQYELVNDTFLPNPVLRRGQKFYFAVRFDRICDKLQDAVNIVFCFGPKPSVTKGTRVVLPVNWNTQQAVVQHSRDVIGMGMGMMQVSHIQETTPNTTSGSTVTAASSPVVISISSVQESNNAQDGRRSSFSNDTEQQSPLSPHGGIDRSVFDRYGTMSQSTFGRGNGMLHAPHHNSVKNLASITHEMDKWDLTVQRQDSNTVTFEVRIPASAPVGVWNCWVQTSRSGQRDNQNNYKCDEDIYILFNPWCRDDSVYIENESLRKEYVFNDQGKIWTGTWRHPKGRKWVYGQFDDVVLPSCMYLLERSGLPHSERGSPVRVCRAISSIINANGDDDGLMVGRYDGEYKDGVAPHSWTGSVAILERYLMNGGRPVEYGQCWVFSGLVVTICRALGIPCRSVTNYVSAHDTNGTLTVDKYFDKDGNEVSNGPDDDCYDSCWNFHAWNEVWMQRPDLPQGYGGWQIIDATPQEEAESVYQCGPASVEAVRCGAVGFQYDTPFVFSQLNSELCHFRENDASDWGFSRTSSNQYQVGRKVVTKTPNQDDEEGDSDLQDITQEHKAVDMTNPSERLAIVTSCRGIQRLTKYYELPDLNIEDVCFDLMDIDLVSYGQPLDFSMNIQNKSSDDRTISCVLTASSSYYTGSIASAIRRSQGEFIVRAGQCEVLKLHVTPQEYMDKLVDHALIKVHAMAYVKQTRQVWSEEDDFPLHKPKILVQVSNHPSVGQECGISLSFHNPLSVHLTDCYFTFEGPGVQRPRQIKFRDVTPNELVNHQERFVPRRAGEKRVVVTFSSRQLDEVLGSAAFTVHN